MFCENIKIYRITFEIFKTPNPIGLGVFAWKRLLYFFDSIVGKILILIGRCTFMLLSICGRTISCTLLENLRKCQCISISNLHSNYGDRVVGGLKKLLWFFHAKPD